MELKKFDSINEFLQITRSVLIENEAENNLMLGIALFIQKNPTIYKDRYLAVILENDVIIAISLCTSPHKLIFWSKNENCNEEIELLVNDAVESKLNTIGVLTAAQHALQIAKLWQELTGRTFKSGMSERIYKLEEVTFPKSVSGSMRSANIKDLPQICKWMEEFQKEAVPVDPMTVFTEFATKKIENEDLVVWEANGQSVSLASRARSTINGICINLVYTPKKFRRNGYASALVAHLSQKLLLDDGWKFVCLFTDLSNPTSNSIYQKVGFKPVYDLQEYIFCSPSVSDGN
jgi:uncharacterized protein